MGGKRSKRSQMNRQHDLTLLHVGPAARIDARLGNRRNSSIDRLGKGKVQKATPDRELETKGLASTITRNEGICHWQQWHSSF